MRERERERGGGGRRGTLQDLRRLQVMNEETRSVDRELQVRNKTEPKSAVFCGEMRRIREGRKANINTGREEGTPK